MGNIIPVGVRFHVAGPANRFIVKLKGTRNNWLAVFVLPVHQERELHLIP